MAETIKFYVEYLKNGTKESEIITAESHEKAVEEIRQKYKGIKYCSAMVLEDHKSEEEFKRTKENKISALANRIYSLDVYGFQDTDTTPADIAEIIKQDPAEVIKYLLDVIDDLQG